MKINENAALFIAIGLLLSAFGTWQVLDSPWALVGHAALLMVFAMVVDVERGE